MSNGTAEVDGRYGPYRVIRSLVRAPGAWLVEGRNDSEKRCILQLARCKPASDPKAKRDRQDYVNMIDAATKHLGNDPDIELLGHGAADEPDGSLMLYWALPWVEGADGLGRAYVNSPARLAEVALGLIKHMETRHERGRLAPTLTEQTLVLRPGRGPTQVGLPLHLPPGWLTSDVPAPRLAPEERDRSEPRLTGDLWRVGRTLRALGAQMTDWPESLKTFVDKMDAESIGDRFDDARAAVTELDGLKSTLESSRDDPADDLLPPPLPQAEGRGDTQISAGPPPLPTPPSDDLTRRLAQGAPIGKDAATVRLELGSKERRDLFGTDGAAPTEPAGDGGEDAGFGETLIDQPAPHIPQARATRNNGGDVPDPEATIQDISLKNLSREDDDPNSRNKEPPTRSTVWDKADAAAPPATKPVGPKGTVVGVRLINEPTGLRGGSKDLNMPSLLPPPGMPGSPEASGQDPSLLPPPQPHNAMHGAQMLPGPMVQGHMPNPGMPNPAMQNPGLQNPAMQTPGMQNPAMQNPAMQNPGMQNPMMPSPGMQNPAMANPAMGSPGLPGAHNPAMPGMQNRASYGHPTVPAITPMPGVAAEAGRYGRTPTTNLPPGADAYGPPTSADVNAPTPGSSSISILIAVVFFVAGVAAAVAGQTLLPNQAATDPKKQPLKVQSIHPAGEVLLQASPANAVVVSERDGQILGQTPMRFLVPSDVEYAVLVTADGHEPTRLILPTRGRLRTDLVPLDERPPCRIRLTTPEQEKLVGVGADVEIGDLYGINGAAVLRSPSGAGAWLVRCPALGGRASLTLPVRPAPALFKMSVMSPAGAEIAIDGQEKGKVPFKEDLKARFVRVKATTLRSGEAERWIPLFTTTRLKMPKPRAKNTNGP